MDYRRVVEGMDSDEEDADLETLRLAALQSRNRRKHPSSYREILKVPREDVRYVSHSSPERSVVKVNDTFGEDWSSDHESSTTDYEEIEISDTNEKSDDLVEICDDFDDDDCVGQSDVSVKDELSHINEGNDISVGGDFNLIDEDRNSSNGYVDAAFEHSDSDDYDTVKVDDENNDEVESFEISQVVERESSENECEPASDDIDAPEESDLLDSEEDVVDNITVTILNDSATVGLRDDFVFKDTDSEILKKDKELEKKEEKESPSVENASLLEEKQETRLKKEAALSKCDSTNENSNESIKKKVIEEESKRKENLNNGDKKISSSNSESSSSSDSESMSSDDSDGSNDSHSVSSTRKTPYSKFVCETKQKHTNDSISDKLLKDSNSNKKTKEIHEPKKDATKESQVDDDQISIGGGASGRDSDFDQEDIQPTVKSAVRTRRLYSESKNKNISHRLSPERPSDQHRFRFQSHRNYSHSQRGRSPSYKDRFHSHIGRSRSRDRFRGRNRSREWSRERLRRSRSRERASYRSRYLDKDPRHNKFSGRENLSNRNKGKLEKRSRSRSRDRKDVVKNSSKSEKRKQIHNSRECKDLTTVTKDSKRLDSVPNLKEEKTQKSYENRIENEKLKDNSQFSAVVKNDNSVVTQKRRDERYDRVENKNLKDNSQFSAVVKNENSVVTQKRRDERYDRVENEKLKDNSQFSAVVKNDNSFVTQKRRDERYDRVENKKLKDNSQFSAVVKNDNSFVTQKRRDERDDRVKNKKLKDNSQISAVVKNDNSVVTQKRRDERYDRVENKNLKDNSQNSAVVKNNSILSQKRRYERYDRVENKKLKDTSQISALVKNDNSVVSQKSRNESNERHDHGTTAVRKFKSQKVSSERYRKNKIEQGDLRERLKQAKMSDAASTGVKKPQESEMKTVVKRCNSKPELVIVKKFTSQPPESKEEDLDAKIAKIKQQNEVIMQRQREIETERRKFLT